MKQFAKHFKYSYWKIAILITLLNMQYIYEEKYENQNTVINSKLKRFFFYVQVDLTFWPIPSAVKTLCLFCF